MASMAMRGITAKEAKLVGTKGDLVRDLKMGSKGDDVSALQSLLVSVGVYPNGSVTGYFGAKTKDAVIRFQEKYASEILTPAGLVKGNGFVGRATRQKVNQLLRK